MFSILRSGRQIIDASTLNFSIDDIQVTGGAALSLVDSYEIDERYPSRGVHSKATNRCRGARFKVGNSSTGQYGTLEVRVFDDGVAYRHVVPGSEKPRIPDEKTCLVLPSRSKVWFHDLGSHYEGLYESRELEQLETGQWLAPPVTCQLADDAGYVVLTEAALADYSGMAFQAVGQRELQIVLGHAQPASYPFELRYADDVERLKEPAAVAGDITTPWRVFIMSADLNGLVNTDIVTNCCPPPDKTLFPDSMNTSWVQPGRAVWRYLDGGENTLAEVKGFSELAGELGFEYQVVEGFWRRSSDQEIADAVNSSRYHGVGLWFWEHSRELRTAESREAFFSRLQKLGVVGAKIDFFDHEHSEVVNLYQALLRDAARHQIMLNFHGANKPTGESRTWPNELIREAVRGAEYRNPFERASHNSTLPFTRYLAGHADYTPVIFNERRGDTTYAHQLATAVVFTHPLLTYAAHPEALLASPASDLIRNIPSVWDETIVLPASEIGEIAAFARRQGSDWFIAVVNGERAKQLTVNLPFLEGKPYRLSMVRDQLDDSPNMQVENISRFTKKSLDVTLAEGGGFVGWFVPISEAD